MKIIVFFIFCFLFLSCAKTPEQECKIMTDKIHNISNQKIKTTLDECLSDYNEKGMNCIMKLPKSELDSLLKRDIENSSTRMSGGPSFWARLYYWGCFRKEL